MEKEYDDLILQTHKQEKPTGECLAMCEQQTWLEAQRLLGQCETLQLAVLDPEGFPRVYPMEKMGESSLAQLCFTTKCASRKVAWLKQNGQASVSFYAGEDSLCLVGRAQVLENAAETHLLWQAPRYRNCFSVDEAGRPVYCVVRFQPFAVEGYLRGEPITISLSQGEKMRNS